MDPQFHTELILKSEDLDTGHSTPQFSDDSKTPVSDSPEGSIGIRPRPLICKPENIDCKSEPIETKWHWAPGAWQDATRTSAFQPYKVCFNCLCKRTIFPYDRNAWPRKNHTRQTNQWKTIVKKVFQQFSVTVLSLHPKMQYKTISLIPATDAAHKFAKGQHKDSNTIVVRKQWYYVPYPCWPRRTHTGEYKFW